MTLLRSPNENSSTQSWSKSRVWKIKFICHADKNTITVFESSRCKISILLIFGVLNLLIIPEYCFFKIENVDIQNENVDSLCKTLNPEVHAVRFQNYSANILNISRIYEISTGYLRFISNIREHFTNIPTFFIIRRIWVNLFVAIRPVWVLAFKQKI